MKLGRLRKLLEAKPRVKIYVLTDVFCLCGYAHDSGEEAERLRVKLAASVRVVLGASEVLQEPRNSGTLVLTEEHKVTRRIQTHRRHLEGMPIPERYFELAREL